MEQASESEKQSFWDHLDILRASLVKIAAVTAVFAVVAFFFKVCVCFHQPGLDGIAQTVLCGLVDDVERLKGLHTG